MSNRLQMGMICKVVKGRINDSNVGKIVELRRHYPVAQNENGLIFHDVWECFCSDGLYHSNGLVGNLVCFESSSLEPLDK